MPAFVFWVSGLRGRSRDSENLTKAQFPDQCFGGGLSMFSLYLGEDQACAVAIVAATETGLRSEQLTGFFQCHITSYHQWAVVIVIDLAVEFDAAGAGRHALPCLLVVGLHLQQDGDAFGEVVVDVAASAELLVFRVEKLAAVAVFADFADDEIRAALAPEDRRAVARRRWFGFELQFAVGELQGNQFAIAFQQGLADDMLFVGSEIGDSAILVQGRLLLCMFRLGRDFTSVLQIQTITNAYQEIRIIPLLMPL